MGSSPSVIERITDAVVVHRVGHSIYRSYFNTVRLCGFERVLDVGCGSGAGARCLAPRLDRGRVTCLEASQGWMAIAKRRLAGFKNVDFITGDASTVDLPVNGYDVAIVHLTLSDIPPARRSAMLRNVTGALRPGGRVYVRDTVDGLRGVSVAHLRQLAEDAGLDFRQAAGGRVAILGSTIELVFAKG